MVRTATLDDKTRVIELLKASRIGAGFDRADGISGFVFPWNEAYAERFFLQHLHSENATAIVHEWHAAGSTDPEWDYLRFMLPKYLNRPIVKT